mgnify:CR=1 FL=1
MAVKLHIKKGDMVYVIAGDSKSTEKTGRVLSVDVKNQRAIVEGFNMIKKHTKPNEKIALNKRLYSSLSRGFLPKSILSMLPSRLSPFLK